MKYAFATMLSVLVAVSAQAVTSTGKPKAANTTKTWVAINKNLSAVTTAVQSKYPFLTELNAAFDPKGSDLAGDKVSANISAATEQAVWQTGKVKMNMAVQIDGSQVVDTQTRMLRGGVDFNLESKTIPALLHTFSYIITKCPADKNDPQKLETAYYCQFYADLTTAKTMADVQAAAASARAGYLNALTALIQKDQEKLAVTTDADEKFNLEYRISKSQESLKEYQSLQISGDANELKLFWPLQFNFGSDLKLEVVVTMTDSVLNAGLKATTTMPENYYQDMKNFVVQMYQQMQSNDPKMIEMMTDFVEGYVEMVRDFVTR